jgi:hypothetical protein
MQFLELAEFVCGRRSHIFVLAEGEISKNLLENSVWSAATGRNRLFKQAPFGPPKLTTCRHSFCEAVNYPV